MKKRIFISGAAGVIGKELVALLDNDAFDILAADIKPRPREFSQNIKYRTGDLNNMTINEMLNFSPNIFIHLAATFERSVESAEFWSDNFKNNILLSHHLMSLIKENPATERVVFASSYLIYDKELYLFNEAPNQATELSETSKIEPRNLIGMAKLAHESELNFLRNNNEYGFSIVSARIFRGYGLNSRDVISRWVRSLINGEPINAYRTDGSFDFIFSRDSAEGLMKLAIQSSVEGVINLGSGVSRTIQEVLNILKNKFPNSTIIGINSQILCESSKANIEKLLTTLKWRPGTTLESGISEIIEFEKSKITGLDKSHERNILITSISRKIPLFDAVSKSWENNSKGKVFAADSNENVVAKYVIKNFWKMPIINEQNFELIKDECLSRNISLILPTRDGELSFWATFKNDFRTAGIEVLVSNLKTIETCLDKLLFFNFGKINNFNVITTSESILDLESNRFVVKERFGAGSNSIGIDLSETEAVNHAKTLQRPIYQPYIVGIEVSIDIWIGDDWQETVNVRRRDLVTFGESQVTTIVSHPKLAQQLVGFAKKLGINGYCVFQAIISENEEIFIIECNPRVGGATTISMNSNMDLFNLIFNNQILEIDNIGMRQVRVPTDIIYYDIDI